MSYHEVTTIVGSSGDEQATGLVDGIAGVSQSVITKIFMWQNADGSNMSCTFQNDKLVIKVQYGLK